QLFALIAAFIGVLVLVEDLYSVNLRIDSILFRSRLSSPAAGRIAPADAAQLVLCGVGLLFINTETRANHRPTELLAIVMAAISIPTLISFSFGALPRPGSTTSLHVTIGFCILAIGLLFARPRRGFTAIATGGGIGGVATRRLLPAFILVPLLLGALFVGLHNAHLIAGPWVAPLFASSMILAFVTIGFMTTLSLHRSDVDRSRAERRLSAQYAATRALTESATVHQAIPVILSSFAGALDWDVGTLWKLDPDRKAIRCVEVWHRPELD